MSEATIRARVKSQVVQAAAASATESHAYGRPAFEDIVSKGYVIIGSPDEVAEQLRHIAKELHVGHLLLLMHYGNMSKDVTRYNTTLFAERVMPQLRDLFSEWDDPWWPKGARASMQNGGAEP